MTPEWRHHAGDGCVSANPDHLIALAETQRLRAEAAEARRHDPVCADCGKGRRGGNHGPGNDFADHAFVPQPE